MSTRELTVRSHKIAAAEFQGSATSVTVKIDNEYQISTTNIGDSGYALFHIVHDTNQNLVLEMYYKSKEGQK